MASGDPTVTADGPYLLTDDLTSTFLGLTGQGNDGTAGFTLCSADSEAGDMMPVFMTASPLTQEVVQICRIDNGVTELLVAGVGNGLLWRTQGTIYPAGLSFTATPQHGHSPSGNPMITLASVDDPTKFLANVDGAAVLSASPTTLTVSGFKANRATLVAQFTSAWGFTRGNNPFFSDGTFMTSDPFYAPTTEDVAKALFAATGITRADYRQDVFDCEDFSIVLRSQAARYALTSGLQAPLNIGIVYARPNGQPPNAHVGNLFVDEMGQVLVMDAGELFAPGDWVENGTNAPYVPYFVLL